MKTYITVIFLTISSFLYGQINTMSFAGPSTTTSGVTFTYVVGAFNGSSDGTTMSNDNGMPYVTPVNGGNDYKDITISQNIYVTSIKVAWAVNVLDFKLQFMNGSTVVKELTGFTIPMGQTKDYTVNAYANKIRYLDAGASLSGGFEIQTVTWDQSLPVELSSFTGYLSKGTVVLKWRTETEINNYDFEIERSATSNNPTSNWEKIGFVSGNYMSNSPKEYSFTDDNPKSGNIHYRLKQSDKDGKLSYYGDVAISVESPKEFKLMQNNPNPFNPSTAINYQIPENTFISLKIYDYLGKEVVTLVNEEKPAGSHVIYWNGKDKNNHMVSSGVYLYKLTAGKYSEIRKMNLLK